MATSSLPADSHPELPKKRSFSLPRFRRASAGERPELAAKSTEEAVRARKAAAWQWHTRGVGEAAKRPPPGPLPPSQAPSTDGGSGFDSGSKGGESITDQSNVLQKKPMKPLGAESSTPASRFKAEACLTRPTNSGAPPPLPPLSDVPSPLYDEFELSGLRTQMADFVHRLQHQQTQDNQQSLAVSDRKKSKPHPDFPAVTSVSNDQTKTKASLVAAATVSDHQVTNLSPSAAPVASAMPFHLRPLSALHRLLRKVVPGSIMRSKEGSLNPSPAVHEPELFLEENASTQYHYHHYIHHHHYHYDQSSEEGAATVHRRHRSFQSSGIRPHIPSLWEAASDDDEEEDVEESPINAYLSRRRRHSGSSAAQLSLKKAAFYEGKAMEWETAKKKTGLGLPLQSERQYKSERFAPNKIPIMVSTDLVHPAAAGSLDKYFDEKSVDIRSRRRHSAEMYVREVACLERKAEEAGGKSGGGKYKLGGAAGGGTPLVQRRHSDILRRSEGVQSAMDRRTPSPGRPYWQSPSARYVVDGLERHSCITASANATLARARSAALPALYAQAQ